MRKTDGYYLYQVGASLQRVKDLKFSWSSEDTAGATYQDAFVVLRNTKESLDKFLKNEFYPLRMCQQKGEALSASIKRLISKIEQDSDKNKLIHFSDIWPITQALDGFEAVLSSEFGLLDLYVITKKGNYDTSGLMLSGEDCFPKELIKKVPECIEDIKAGTKCIAVSLPTAAGFHLHRANEAVLHKYWDAVTGNTARPEPNNMGIYISQMEKMNVGDKRLLSALKDLKDLHRNPLIHPGQTLDSVDDAIALLNHVHTLVVHMLKAIPESATNPLSAIKGASSNIAEKTDDLIAANG